MAYFDAHLQTAHSIYENEVNEFELDKFAMFRTIYGPPNNISDPGGMFASVAAPK